MRKCLEHRLLTLSQKGNTMRLLAMIIAILLSVQAAEARDCELPEQTSAILTHQIPPRSFFLSILAEIDDLKKKQAELERIVPEYERLLAELPAHYENRNGKVTFEEGRRIGSASFVLASRQLGGPSSVELDATVIDALCGPPNGCSITLTFRKLGFRTAEPLETLRIGPCQFEIDSKSGCWVCGAGCGSDVSIEGIDGDGNALDPGSGASVVMEVGPGCLLADSDARTTPGAGGENLATDNRRGVFLVADTTRRDDGTTRFECDLEIE